MKSIYDKSANVLKEQPEGNGLFEKEYNAYFNIRTIPCSENNWKDGQELEEGKDYEVGPYENGLLAVPIIAQETEDELWEDVLHITDDPRRGYEDEKTISELKSKFTIKRKL